MSHVRTREPPVRYVLGVGSALRGWSEGSPRGASARDAKGPRIMRQLEDEEIEWKRATRLVRRRRIAKLVVFAALMLAVVMFYFLFPPFHLRW
jgi:hypothetical protein